MAVSSKHVPSRVSVRRGVRGRNANRGKGPFDWNVFPMKKASCRVSFGFGFPSHRKLRSGRHRPHKKRGYSKRLATLLAADLLTHNSENVESFGERPRWTQSAELGVEKEAPSRGCIAEEWPVSVEDWWIPQKLMLGLQNWTRTQPTWTLVICLKASVVPSKAPTRPTRKRNMSKA